MKGAFAATAAVDTVEFTPVAARDLPMIADWIARAHWQEWWGDPDTEIGYIRDMIEGRDGTRPFIFHVDGEATGYIQVWDVGPHQTEQWAVHHPWLMALPIDAIGVDLSIGPDEKLSQGIGSAVLKAFAQALVNDGHRTIIIDPDLDNARAIRAYFKAGFRPMPNLDGMKHDVLIMQFQLDADQP